MTSSHLDILTVAIQSLATPSTTQARKIENPLYGVRQSHFDVSRVTLHPCLLCQETRCPRNRQYQYGHQQRQAQSRIGDTQDGLELGNTWPETEIPCRLIPSDDPDSYHPCEHSRHASRLASGVLHGKYQRIQTPTQMSSNAADAGRCCAAELLRILWLYWTMYSVRAGLRAKDAQDVCRAHTPGRLFTSWRSNGGMWPLFPYPAVSFCFSSSCGQGCILPVES